MRISVYFKHYCVFDEYMHLKWELGYIEPMAPPMAPPITGQRSILDNFVPPPGYKEAYKKCTH